MKAVWLEEFGGPEALIAADAPDPVPGPGQALIEVAYANITFVETQFRASGFGPFETELPMIPGNGVGGVVASVGVEADERLIGKRVVASTGGSGGYAERAAVDAVGLVEVPEGLELDSAVALLADGRTAMMLVQKAGLREGDRVLVEAACELGADVTVDYREPGWAERVREAVGAVDVVFDGVGGDVGRSAFGLLDRGGRMIRFGMASGEWAKISDEAAAGRGVELIGLSRLAPEEMRAFTEDALAKAAAGRLRPVIGQIFPLDRAADAHAAIESRATVGKTLLVT